MRTVVRWPPKKSFSALTYAEIDENPSGQVKAQVPAARGKRFSISTSLPYSRFPVSGLNHHSLRVLFVRHCGGNPFEAIERVIDSEIQKISPQIAHQIRMLAMKYDEAFNRNDAAAVAALSSEDAVLSGPPGRFNGRMP